MFYKIIVFTFCTAPIFAGKESLQITCNGIKKLLRELNQNQSIHIFGIGTKPTKINNAHKSQLVDYEIICEVPKCNKHQKCPRNIWVTYLVLEHKTSYN